MDTAGDTFRRPGVGAIISGVILARAVGTFFNTYAGVSDVTEFLTFYAPDGLTDIFASVDQLVGYPDTTCNEKVS